MPVFTEWSDVMYSSVSDDVKVAHPIEHFWDESRRRLRDTAPFRFSRVNGRILVGTSKTKARYACVDPRVGCLLYSIFLADGASPPSSSAHVTTRRPYGNATGRARRAPPLPAAPDPAILRSERLFAQFRQQGYSYANSVMARRSLRVTDMRSPHVCVTGDMFINSHVADLMRLSGHTENADSTTEATTLSY